MVRQSLLAVLAVAAFVSCGDNTPADITITTTASFIGPLQELAAETPWPGLQVVEVDAPSPPTRDDAGFQIALVEDADIPTEGFRVDAIAGTTRAFAIHTHDVLGAQYGVAALLEHLGFRFRHPTDTLVPTAPTPDDRDGVVGPVHFPQTRVRGFQFHTLHPIEPYFAAWENAPGALDDWKAMVDWVVKNRGNFIQWAALDDIYDQARYSEWQPQTRAMIDYAHSRGVRVGLAFELFSTANLQFAFDVIDDTTAPFGPQVAARLPLIVDQLPFDVYALSFGEFVDSDPDQFISAVNEVATQIHALAPNAEMHGVVHLGATQTVQYEGMTLPYYFLLKFADPSIVPDIHTAMYFDLFESAGGAYGYASFGDHLEYLVDRMCAQQPAAYYPEDAYWVAFDNSVPTFMPIYVRSRWTDLKMIPTAAPPPCAPLDEHLVFSSGWEWGFWLNDTTSLRSSYELPSDPHASIDQQLEPDLGHAAAELVGQLADAQHDALIGDGLAAYVAGRDALIEAAAPKIVSQPDRITFDELAAGSAADRDAFDSSVLTPLEAHRDAVAQLQSELDALDLPASRWTNEIRDGFAVDHARVQFVSALYRATLAHLAGDDAGAAVARADAASAFADGKAIIARRDGDLHDRHQDRLFTRGPNHTAYQFGYLFMGATQCYWSRELAQVDAILGNSTAQVPACIN
jgi:hypothetical protein|nr:hypothetical protein [Kofleriaceae bacterium]